MKKNVLVVLVMGWGLVLTSWAQESAPEARPSSGPLVQLGGGPAAVWYGGAPDDLAVAMEAAGINRADLCVGVSAGWAFVPGLYILGVVDAYVTNFFDAYGGYLQLADLQIGAGGRWYPFDVGLLLQLTGGLAGALITSNIGLYGQSPWGYVGEATVGWDFGESGGFSLVVAASVSYLSIPDWQHLGVGITANLAWKSPASVHR